MTTNLVEPTKIWDVRRMFADVFPDERGSFSPIFLLRDFERQLGNCFTVKQANRIKSKRGALRGIHRALSYGKLIYVWSGEIQQVIVDLRPKSKTVGKHSSVNLTEGQSIFVPSGCGNAILGMNKESEILYLTEDYWRPGQEMDIVWNDPDLAIEWQIMDPILSDERDRKANLLRDVFPGLLTEPEPAVV